MKCSRSILVQFLLSLSVVVVVDRTFAMADSTVTTSSATSQRAGVEVRNQKRQQQQQSKECLAGTDKPGSCASGYNHNNNKNTNSSSSVTNDTIGTDNEEEKEEADDDSTTNQDTVIVLPKLSNCPIWAKEVLCEAIDIGRQQTYLYDYRGLQDCPIPCQVCRRPTFNINDQVSANEAKQAFQMYQKLEGYRHCAPDPQNNPDIWTKPGEMEDMYETIIHRFPQYSPTVLSRPNYVNGDTAENATYIIGPYIITLEDFLTDEECMAMIEQTKIALKDIGKSANAVLADDEEMDDDEGMGVGECKSSQAWCDDDTCMHDPRLTPVWDRTSHLFNMPFDHAEEVHFIQYVPGQRYGPHTDYIKQEKESVHGPRLFTILFYMNDIPDGVGGETCFPSLDLCVKPKKGKALIWPQVVSDHIPYDKIDNSTWHLAHGVTEGYKYASTIWFHLRNYTHAKVQDCIETYEEDDDDDDDDDVKEDDEDDEDEDDDDEDDDDEDDDDYLDDDDYADDDVYF